MQAKEKHDIGHLEVRIKEVSSIFAKLYNAQEFETLIKHIHQPGWTTPAEFTLVSGVVESMLAQGKALTNLKQTLFDGSRSIGTN